VAGFPKFELSDLDATIAIFCLLPPLAAAPELDPEVVEPEAALELELELDPQPAANAAPIAHAVNANDRTPLLICSPFLVVVSEKRHTRHGPSCSGPARHRGARCLGSAATANRGPAEPIT